MKTKISAFINKHLYLSYTLLFLLLYTFSLLPFELKDSHFSLQGYFSEPALYYDGFKQHIVFMYDFIKQLKGFFFHGEAFQIYRFDIGLGADFFITYGFYGLWDPLNIIALILPLSEIGLSYTLISATRVYLCGLFMIILAKQLGISKNSSLLMTGLVYAFSYPVLYSAFRHPFFVNGPLYLPLLIIGGELIIKKKSPFLFILAVFLSVISQFYFFVYTSFGFTVYIIIRLWDELKVKQFINLISIIIYALLGVLLGSFVVFPNLLALMEVSRTTPKGLVLYTIKELITIILSNLIPVIGAKYSIGIGNLVLLLGCFIYVFHKEKEHPHRYLRLSFISFFILQFISLFAFLINGCTYVNNRWYFMIMVPVSLIFGFIIDGQVKLAEKDYQKGYELFLSIIGLLLILILLQIIITFKISLIIRIFLIILLLVLIGVSVLLIRKTSLINMPPFIQSIFETYKYKKVMFMLIIITILAVMGYYMFDTTPKNGFEVYYPNKDLYQAEFNDDEFYRVEHKVYEGNVLKYSNDNLVYGFKATYQYNSMVNGYVNKYLDALEVTNLNNTTGYNGFEGRTILLNLNHVKYLIIRESEKSLPPYGFKLVKTVEVPKYNDKGFNALQGNITSELEKVYIYENENYLDFGYMMYKTLNETSYLNLDYLTRQEVLLDYVVLSQGDIVNIDSHDYHVVAENLTIKNGSYQFTIPRVTNQEVYVYVEGMEILALDDMVTITYETKDVLRQDSISPKGKNTYKDNANQLINLGYYENETNLYVTISLPKEAKVKRISYALLDVTQVTTKIAELNQHVLKNVTFTHNGFSGEITTPHDGYLVISLPYSKGFKAFVDGKETEIYLANLGLMAIKVPSGTHHISFTYMTKGLTTSLYLSLTSLIVTSGIFIVFIIKKIKLKRNVSN